MILINCELKLYEINEFIDYFYLKLKKKKTHRLKLKTLLGQLRGDNQLRRPLFFIFQDCILDVYKMHTYYIKHIQT